MPELRIPSEKSKLFKGEQRSKTTDIPKRVPERCAPWSNRRQPSARPALSNSIMLLRAVAAEIVKNGKNMITNSISGLAIQHEARSPKMAPDFENKFISEDELPVINRLPLLMKSQSFE